MTRQVGCERDDDTLNIHGEAETCEVCAPVEIGNAPIARKRTPARSSIAARMKRPCAVRAGSLVLAICARIRFLRNLAWLAKRFGAYCGHGGTEYEFSTV